MCPARDVARPTTTADLEPRLIPTVAGAVPLLAAGADFPFFFFFLPFISQILSPFFFSFLAFTYVCIVWLLLNKEVKDLNKDIVTLLYNFLFFHFLLSSFSSAAIQYRRYSGGNDFLIYYFEIGRQNSEFLMGLGKIL